MSIEENLKHQGTLEKQCKLKTWAWKKYWFVLFNEQLCYYKEQDSAKMSGGGRRLSSTELGEIDLGQAHSIREIKNNNRSFAFEISTKSRNFILSADKEESRVLWLKLLHQAMALGISKRRNNSIRSIKSSCNSIDETDDGYSDIQTTTSHRINNSVENQLALRLNTPAPPPPTLNRPESTTLRHSIREETEDDLYSDIQSTESGNYPDNHVIENESADEVDDQETYSYAEVEMRKKKWKFMNQTAVDVPEEDDIYTEVNYNSTYETKYHSTTSQNNETVKATTTTTTTVNNNEQQQLHNNDKTHSIVEYAKVLPKAQRLARTTSAMEQTNAAKEKDDDYVHLRDVTSNKHATLFATKSMLEFPTIPSLAHPRVEYTDRSHFDDIRLFLSRNRGMDEVFRDPPHEQLSGNSINKLHSFLSSVGDESVKPEVETTHL